MIPDYLEKIRYISMKLDENERGATARGISGTPSAMAAAFAKLTPTSTAPISPAGFQKEGIMKQGTLFFRILTVGVLVVILAYLGSSAGEPMPMVDTMIEARASTIIIMGIQRINIQVVYVHTILMIKLDKIPARVVLLASLVLPAPQK